jgi:arylsulfatase A-like enzyme
MGLTAGAIGTLTVARAQQRAPNIVLILADDLGYGDLGCYGQKLIQTPRIDELASQGVRFTQAYAGSTVCAPSRACLMTGLHTGHARIRGNARVDLTPEDRTIPEVLKAAGYRTALFGKWGLGTAGNSGIPTRKGFDEFFGFLDQKHAHTYYPTQLWDGDREAFLDGNFGDKRTDYAPDVFTDRAVDFIGKNRANPFFLYYANTLPHANNEMTKQTGNGNQVPDDAPYSGRDWPQPDKNFAAMVTHLDRNVGRILDSLKSSGLERDTLVILSSDNGPHREGGNRPEFFNSSGGLRGIKRDLYEGGIRVPGLARWPGKVRPGSVSNEPWAFWDLLPTFAEVARAETPKGLDGRSILPLFSGGTIERSKPFYWEFHEKGFSQAVRKGKWKAVRRLNRKAPVELYDLEKDVAEARDLSRESPDLVRQMAKYFDSERTDSSLFPIRES